MSASPGDGLPLLQRLRHAAFSALTGGALADRARCCILFHDDRHPTILATHLPTRPTEQTDSPPLLAKAPGPCL